MGVEIKLTDRELPVSPVFIDFLSTVVEGRPWPETRWHDQLSEDLASEHKGVLDRAADNAKRVMASKDGQRHIGRAYQFLVGLLTGNLDLVREIQFKYHFINVIGIPRNGGSYLTMEAYRALGYDPTRVPNVIAHDGFPEAGPFRFEKGINSWVTSLQTMAEFLTMVEIYFGDAKPHFGKVVVPKKLLKGTYAGGFFHRILGESVENILTVRHPVACAISTYEKSGGLPEHGRFVVRGNIEEWARRDLTYTRFTDQELQGMDYFEAYLRYWEQYHYYIATTGLSANRNVTITPFTQAAMLATSRRFHARFESGLEPSEFKVFDKRDRHPDWVRSAAPVVQRVAEVWERAGLRFPLDEVNQMW